MASEKIILGHKKKKDEEEENDKMNMTVKKKSNLKMSKLSE